MRFIPVVLLCLSNVSMTHAWYGHLKDMRSKPLLIAIIVGWCIAFFGYCLQAPGNRMGIGFFFLPQPEVIQEVVTMGVSAVFCTACMRQRVSWDQLWASLCLVGAAFFMFRYLPA